MPPPMMRRTRPCAGAGASARDAPACRPCSARAAAACWPGRARPRRRRSPRAGWCATSSSIERPLRGRAQPQPLLQRPRRAGGRSGWPWHASSDPTRMIALQSMQSSSFQITTPAARRSPTAPARSSGCGAPRPGRSPRRSRAPAPARRGSMASSCSTRTCAARPSSPGTPPRKRPTSPAPCGRVLEPPGRAEMALDPFAHHRLGDRPHVELGIERARHAFDHHHGLLQQQQLRPRPHVEQAGDLEQQRQQLRHRDFVGGAVVDRLADGADRLREALDRMMRRHVAGLEMHLGGAVIVAGDEAVEDLGEEAPLLRRRAGP